MKVLSNIQKDNKRAESSGEIDMCDTTGTGVPTTGTQTFTKIQHGYLDWSGNVRSKRRTRKHILKTQLKKQRKEARICHH